MVGSRGHGRLGSFSTVPVHAVEHCPHHHSDCGGTRGIGRDHREEYWDPIQDVIVCICDDW